MPYNRRYRSDSWHEQRAMDRYYEYLEEACDCDVYYVDDDGNAVHEDQSPCYYCKRRARLEEERAEREREEQEYQQQLEAQRAAQRAAQLAANPHKEQILFIGAKLKEVAAAEGAPAKVEIVREMFTYILEQQEFLSIQPKFRAAVVKKMDELRADEKAVALLPLFSQMDAMIAGLPARADYKV